MKRAVLACAAVALCLLPSKAAQANLQAEVDSWFGSSTYSNGTPAGGYTSQVGGYYTGGTMSVRVPTRDVGGWVSVTPPKFQGGCGGIDLDLGGFNMVNKDAIVQQLRAIGQNAKALAFTMAIKYISSLLGSTMETVKGFADGLNKMQLDSCEAAAGLLAAAGDGIGGMTGRVKEGCIQVQMAKNNLTYDEARTRCTSDQNQNAVMAAEKNVRYFTNGNLAWFSMMQSPWLRNDLDTAEILMNLTGTIIAVPGATAADVAQPVYVPPMALDCQGGGEGCMSTTMKAFVDGLVFGAESGGFKGDIWMVKCEPTTKTSAEFGCSSLQNNGAPEKVDASTLPSTKAKVRAIVNSIYQKIYVRDAQLSNNEKAFIEAVAVPIYRYILASASAFRYNSAAQDYMLNSYLDNIARELVAANLAAMLDNVKQHMSMAKLNPEADGYKKEYLANIEKVQKAVVGMGDQAQQQLEYLVQVQERSQAYERVVISRMSAGMLASAMYGH